jgi:hypothetical protein
MEKAIIINRQSALNDEALEYDLIYFGNEFCQWLLPSVSELKSVTGFCKDNGKKLVLLTPWVTDSGLDKLHKLLDSYFGSGEDHEIVVNDLGVLKLISDEFEGRASITLGRLLSNQRRDPRTLPLKDIGSRELYEHYQHSSFDYQPVLDYFSRFNVNRVEIDNLFQGVIVPNDIKGVSFSMYYPYNYVTVTRNCAFCYEADNSVDPWNNKKSCMKRCVDTVLKLTCDEIEEPLYLKGTAIFVKNDKVDVKENEPVSRLVYCKEIPV